ncbi:MAG: exodeoxyribonuclease V subunit gamma, partial [Anaerolineales bacterium]|nr:exodeoxyribonuclease V subunit gamma [Anaerolineales bacterium]
GQPLQQSPVINALLALLRLYLPLNETGELSLPRRPVIAAWRSPYFDWGSGGTAITPADADLLDTFARQQLVIRGLSQWQAAFAAGSAAINSDDGDVYEEDEAGREIRLTGAQIQQLQQKFSHFLATSQPPDTATTMRDFVQWLETLIGLDPQAPGNSPQPGGSLQIVVQARNNPTTAVADVAALRTLKDILRGLVWAEAAVGQNRPIDYALFFNELMGAIAATHYMLPPRTGQPEILIASVTQVRGLSFAAVAVIGLSEGAFPATISEDPFLRDADRRILRDRFALQLEPSTRSAEREFFYEAVTRAREKLLLTRPVLADNGAEWVASPFWETVRSLVTVKSQSIGSTAVLPLTETASWVEWWEVVAADGALDTQNRDEAIRRQIETAATIWQIREGADKSIWQGDLSSLAAELTAHFGPDHIWSASRLEAYQTCGYLFFLQNVLKIESRPEPAEGLDIRQLGSVYHTIFEMVTSSGLSEPSEETAVQAQVVAVATPILDAAPEQQGFRQTPWWAQTRQEIIDNVTRSIMALEAGEYIFFKAEASFGIHGPPLVIGVDDDQLCLRGFIDRIDQHDDGSIRIIDYKSGGKSAYTFPAFQNGKKLQLPLYALAAQETLGLGTVSDGFYWHFQQAERSSFQLQKAKKGEEGIDGIIRIAIRHAWDAVQNIRDGQFAPRPPDDGCPNYCPAAAFCWQYRPRYR